VSPLPMTISLGHGMRSVSLPRQAAMTNHAVDHVLEPCLSATESAPMKSPQVRSIAAFHPRAALRS